MSSRLPPTIEPAPVIEAYKKDVDRSLIRENLKLTVEERLINLMTWSAAWPRFLCFGLERLILARRAAGRPKDFEAIAGLETILEESRE